MDTYSSNQKLRMHWFPSTYPNVALTLNRVCRLCIWQSPCVVDRFMDCTGKRGCFSSLKGSCLHTHTIFSSFPWTSLHLLQPLTPQRMTHNAKQLYFRKKMYRSKWRKDISLTESWQIVHCIVMALAIKLQSLLGNKKIVYEAKQDDVPNLIGVSYECSDTPNISRVCVFLFIKLWFHRFLDTTKYTKPCEILYQQYLWSIPTSELVIHSHV